MSENNKENTSTDFDQRALSYNDLKQLGEGSRWTVGRRIERGSFPPPDFYQDDRPKWLGSTIRENRARLIQETRDRREEKS